MKVSRFLPIVGLLAAAVGIAAPLDEPPAFLLKWGSWGTGPGQFKYPYGIGTDSQGNVYVADKLNNRIQKFTGSGIFVRQWGGFGVNLGQFEAPTGLAVSPDDLIYVCDKDNGRIQVFTGDGVFVNQWTAGGNGIAIDHDGSVYVATVGDAIKKFNHDGVLIAQWGSTGSGPGQFREPIGIAADQLGNVFVADVLNGRIEKFATSGSYLGVWPSAGSIYLAVDAAGSLYATNQNSHSVLKYSPSGTLLTQWGSFGTGDGQFKYPNGIAVDLNGNVFVGDPDEGLQPGVLGRIQKFREVPVSVAPGRWGTIKARYR